MPIKEAFQKICKSPTPTSSCEISDFFRTAILYSKEPLETATS